MDTCNMNEKGEQRDDIHCLYCIVCKTPSRNGVDRSLLQERQHCEACGIITTHQNAASLFDVEALLWELEQIQCCDKCDLCEDHHG